jgi:hypothetical protein
MRRSRANRDRLAKRGRGLSLDRGLDAIAAEQQPHGDRQDANERDQDGNGDGCAGATRHRVAGCRPFPYRSVA